MPALTRAKGGLAAATLVVAAPVLALLHSRTRTNGGAPDIEDCEPWSVPAEARCQYIADRASASCREHELLLRLYFCAFAGW